MVVQENSTGMQMSTNQPNMKKLGELLLQGAKMLDKSCPDCNVPLFQMKDGTIKCASCNRKVIFAKSDEEVQVLESRLHQQEAMLDLLATLHGKAAFLSQEIAIQTDVKELEKLLGVLGSLLDVIYKAQRIQNEFLSLNLNTMHKKDRIGKS